MSHLFFCLFFGIIVLSFNGPSHSVQRLRVFHMFSLEGHPLSDLWVCRIVSCKPCFFWKLNTQIANLKINYKKTSTKYIFHIWWTVVTCRPFFVICLCLPQTGSLGDKGTISFYSYADAAQIVAVSLDHICPNDAPPCIMGLKCCCRVIFQSSKTEVVVVCLKSRATVYAELSFESHGKMQHKSF